MESDSSLYLRAPDDMHLHLRQGEALISYSRDSARYFARGLVMPNTQPPLLREEDLRDYRRRIIDGAPEFFPLMTFKLLESTNPEQIQALKEAGALAGKLYPRGATTNSEDGVSNFAAIDGCLEAMSAQDLVLCVHAEEPGAPALKREADFLHRLDAILNRHTKLKLVVEHVSTAEAVSFVQACGDRVGASVTVHHLLLTIDDLLGEKLKPHLFCKPVVKNNSDRKALREAVFAGDPKFFFGSDSAPHLRIAKESAASAAGVYTAPVAFPLLLELFETTGNLDYLEGFTSKFGADFYGLPLNSKRIRCYKQSWRVPEEFSGVVPLYAGRSLQWKAELEDS